MGVFKKLILGWIQVDRMMVLCWKMSVVIIFDKIGYKGSLQDDLHKLLGHSIGNKRMDKWWNKKRELIRKEYALELP